MIIAIASGKGGTGKTTISTNLALTLAQQGRSVQLLDCDVEEPNCHIFVRPEIHSSRPVDVRFPRVIAERCTGCGVCASVCEYSAIIVVKGKVLIFPELCHGCGGCSLFCPEKALEEAGRSVGIVEQGVAGPLGFVHGLLDVGELATPAVIREVKKSVVKSDIVIVDSPPGTSCPVIESVKDADFVLLVTEPTPFGLNDLKIAVEMVRALGIPFVVAVNRCDIGDEEVRGYCRDEGIAIVLNIPDDRRIAEAYSRGEMIIDAVEEYKGLFEELWQTISERDCRDQERKTPSREVV